MVLGSAAKLADRLPGRAGRTGRSAGEAELAAIGAAHAPSLSDRVLAPIASLVVTIAVYGLLATSLATALCSRRETRPT